MKIFKCFLFLFFVTINTYCQSTLVEFFNDSLKGKWILNERCVLEAQSCNNIGKDVDYIIFKSIDNNDIISYELYENNTLKTGTVKLYHRKPTIIDSKWCSDNFYGSNDSLYYSFNDIDNLAILQDLFIGYVGYYKRDIDFPDKIPNIKESYIQVTTQNRQLQIESKEQIIRSVTLINASGLVFYKDEDIKSSVYNKNISYSGFLLCIVILENGEIVKSKIMFP